MTSKLLLGLASFVVARSRRLRWLAPALPLAVAAYQLYRHARASAAAPVAEASLAPPDDAAPAIAPPKPSPARSKTSPDRPARAHPRRKADPTGEDHPSPAKPTRTRRRTSSAAGTARRAG